MGLLDLRSARARVLTPAARIRMHISGEKLPVTPITPSAFMVRS